MPLTHFNSECFRHPLGEIRVYESRIGRRLEATNFIDEFIIVDNTSSAQRETFSAELQHSEKFHGSTLRHKTLPKVYQLSDSVFDRVSARMRNACT